MSTTSVRRSEPQPVAANFRGYSGRIIRMVEAQHRISTDRLVDGPAEQEVLEQLIAEVKPTLPAAARGLHHLLATPFRYGHVRESRFRRAGERPGIFYASEQEGTAVAETAYCLMRFFSASPGMRLPDTTLEHWAFSIPVRVSRALDLTDEPLVRGRPLWIRPRDYAPCQRLAEVARAIHAQLIRYESVRDPSHGANLALLDPTAFQKPVPLEEHTWHMRFHADRLTAFSSGPSGDRHDFTFRQFGLTPP